MKVLEAQLPERGGYCRPHQLGQIVEVKVGRNWLPHKEQKNHMPPFSLSWATSRTGWRAVHSVNIIELVSELAVFRPGSRRRFRHAQLRRGNRAGFAGSDRVHVLSRDAGLCQAAQALASLGTCSAHCDKWRDGEFDRMGAVARVFDGLFNRGTKYEERGFYMSQQDGPRMCPRFGHERAAAWLERRVACLAHFSSCRCSLPAPRVLPAWLRRPRTLAEVVRALEPVLLPLGQRILRLPRASPPTSWRSR